MRFVSDFFNILLDSDEFFHSKEQDKPKWAFFYFIFLSLIGLGINMLLFTNGIVPGGVLMFDNVLKPDQLGFLIYAFFLLGFPFHLLYALVLFVTLRRKTPMGQVYKASVYGFTPSMITLWIPVIGLLLLSWSVYITVMGLHSYNKQGIRKNLWAAIISGIIIGIVVLATTLTLGLHLSGNKEFWTLLINDFHISLA